MKSDFLVRYYDAISTSIAPAISIEQKTRNRVSILKATKQQRIPIDPIQTKCMRKQSQ